MKKLLIALLAIMFVASLFTVATAEDKLSISGTMRVRAIDAENYNDFDDNNDEQDIAYWDQRLRLSGKFKANDAVSAHFRMDFAEDDWGSDNWGGSRYSEASELQVDRAYMQIVQDLYTLKAGQLFFSTGENYIVYDNNTTGITLTLKLPVIIDLHYSKLDENGSRNDDNLQDDVDAYVAQATYKGENFSVGAFYAAIEDERSAPIAAAGEKVEDSPNAFGVFGSLALGQLKLQAELDIFGGDYTDDTGASIDYLGEQFWVNAEYAMESLILGGNLMYAAAQDKDGSEEQISGLNNWGAWQPSTYGPFLEDFMQGPHAGGAEDFNFTGDGAGAVGGTVYAKWNPMEKLILWGSLAYFEAEDDSLRITTTEDITIANLSAQYELVPNTTIAAMYSTSLISTATGEPDDDASQIAARLQVKF